MVDIVEAAIHNQENNPGHGEVIWIIVFVTNESIKGKIGILGGSNYVVEASDRTYFFSADKVAYMYPRK